MMTAILITQDSVDTQVLHSRNEILYAYSKLAKDGKKPKSIKFRKKPGEEYVFYEDLYDLILSTHSVHGRKGKTKYDK